MKILLISLIILAFSSGLIAECTDVQKASTIEIEIEQLKNRARSNGNHDFMDVFQIKAPVLVAGTKLVYMELTEGEVANFWIPLAYKISGDFAVTEITGYRESIKNFEVAVYYRGGECSKSIQRLLGI